MDKATYFYLLSIYFCIGFMGSFAFVSGITNEYNVAFAGGFVGGIVNLYCGWYVFNKLGV